MYKNKHQNVSIWLYIIPFTVVTLDGHLLVPIPVLWPESVDTRLWISFRVSIHLLSFHGVGQSSFFESGFELWRCQMFYLLNEAEKYCLR